MAKKKLFQHFIRRRYSLQEKLVQRRLHKPNYIIYRILAFAVVKLMFEKKLNISYDYKVDPKDIKAPFIVVGNHASRLDYIYSSLALLPHSLNYMAGYNEFFRSHLAFILRLMQVIPKKNFVNDVYAIKQMHQIINEKGNIIFFPEGMSSISGANQPSAIASGKLLKHFGLPVLCIKISGGYLTNTKYCLDLRPGHVNVEVDMLFTPEKLSILSAEEIQLKLDKALWNDDFEWNKTARVQFRGGGKMAKNIQDMLFLCPRCNSEFTIESEGDRFYCNKCGNGAIINEYYDFIPFDHQCIIPDSLRVWWDMQRDRIHDLVRSSEFSLEDEFYIGILPKNKYLRHQQTSEIVGEGNLTLNHEGVSFVGTYNDECFEFKVSSLQVPTLGICTDMSRFFIYINDEYIEFVPKKRTVAKWLLAVEENHRYNNGLWQPLFYPR